MLAGAAGSVKRHWFCNSGHSCVCVIRLYVQQGFSGNFADASSKAVKSLQIGDGVSGAADSFYSAWVCFSSLSMSSFGGRCLIPSEVSLSLGYMFCS